MSWVALATALSGGCSPESDVSGPSVADNPVPIVVALSSDVIETTSLPAVLTVLGSGFVQESVVRMNAADRPTTFVDSTQVAFEVGAEETEAPGSRVITVFNPLPGGGRSGEAYLEIKYPAPILDGVSPDTVTMGEAERLYLSGANIYSNTVLLIDERVHESAIRVAGPSELYLDVAPETFGTTGPVSISLLNPMSGDRSAPITVEVVDRPRIISSVPSSLTVGSPTTTVTLVGRGFDASSEVLWNGSPRTTLLVDSGSLEFQVTPADIAGPTTASVTVTGSGIRDSEPHPLPVVPAVPTILDQRSLDLWTTDLAADPVRNLVYATVPWNAPSHADELVAIDPFTAAIVWSIPVGSAPRQVVVSDDGGYAYVALIGESKIVRVDLESRAISLVIDLPEPVGLPWTNGITIAEDLTPLPGAPRSVVASLLNTCCNPGHRGVAVFDDDVVRPEVPQGTGLIEPSSDGRVLYGVESNSLAPGLASYTVHAGGLILDRIMPSSFFSQAYGELFFDRGLLFTTYGDVIRPEDFAVVGSLRSLDNLINVILAAMRPDVANGRLHYYTGGSAYVVGRLVTREVHSLEELGELELADATGSTVLVRFGSDGLAFGGRAGTVLFIRSDLVGP